MTSALSCPVCGDAIGVYESVLVLGKDGSRNSSLAREPRLTEGDEMVLHISCSSGPGASSGLTAAA
jgi:hypothetical protein